MGDSRKNAVIAVDAGGTRCRLALDDGISVTSVETGAANVSTDFDGAIAQISAGLIALAGKAGVTPDSMAHMPAFIGMAGVTGQAIADRVRGALPFRDARVEDDRPAALRGALGDRDGVIAHCGTGSFFASQQRGRMRFAGGWGPVLGDEASAQWIGRKALGITLLSVDGRIPSSPMAERLLSDHGGAAGIVRFAGNASPPRFGALAPLVTELAQAGDPLARRVLQSGADQISSVVPDLGWHAGMTICLTGGIGPHYLPYLPDHMRNAVAHPVAEPLTGALDLARAFAREVADERG
ncbi:MAG: ATPase [Silicimonas sp.]|nr:ATPase [Silicimonas sp.]